MHIVDYCLLELDKECGRVQTYTFQNENGSPVAIFDGYAVQAVLISKKQESN